MTQQRPSVCCALYALSLIMTSLLPTAVSYRLPRRWCVTPEERQQRPRIVYGMSRLRIIEVHVHVDSGVEVGLELAGLTLEIRLRVGRSKE